TRAPHRPATHSDLVRRFGEAGRPNGRCGVNQTPSVALDPRGRWATRRVSGSRGLPGMAKNGDPFPKYRDIIGPPPAHGECLCNGTGRVLMQGYHAHTEPCPWCREDDYLAGDPDTDHYLIRQCRECGAATADN